MSGWSVYLVRCADGTLYCGVALDVEKRVAQHNAGKGARYTRGRRPVALLWREDGHSRGDALRRELQVKALQRARKERLVSSS